MLNAEMFACIIQWRSVNTVPFEYCSQSSAVCGAAITVHRERSNGVRKLLNHRLVCISATPQDFLWLQCALMDFCFTPSLADNSDFKQTSHWFLQDYACSEPYHLCTYLDLLILCVF